MPNQITVAFITVSTDSCLFLTYVIWLDNLLKNKTFCIMLFSIWTIETVKNKINIPYLILSSFIKLRHVRAIAKLRLFPKVASSHTQVKYFRQLNKNIRSLPLLTKHLLSVTTAQTVFNTGYCYAIYLKKFHWVPVNWVDL